MILKHLDRLYEHDGLAKMVVKANIIGIYSVSMASFTYKDESMNITADLFVAKYGGELSMYAMMLYFANYLMEYKTSHSAFDMQDILQQCGKKFLPWWRDKLSNLENDRPKEKVKGLIGRDAKIAMLGERLIKGQTLDDIKKCNLYRFGYTNDKDFPDIVEYAQNNF